MKDDDVFSLAIGIGIGAALGSGAMYILDPQTGASRRALARDKMIEAQTNTKRAAGVTARDLWNRAVGFAAEACSRISEGEVSDQVLEGRVRSKLGFLARNPSSIAAHVSQGRVRLSGPILSDEVQQLMKGIRSVRGVTGVENRLDVFDDAGQVPGLQGDKPRPGGEVWDVMQRRWSPATRFLIGAAGAVSLGLIAYSLADGSQSSLARERPQRQRSRVAPEESRAGWGI